MSAVESPNPEHLSITTAAIEVKILTVNNRKLTQAVFRQIPYMYDAIEYETLDFFPSIRVWGYVNYYWDKNHSLDNCFHVLLSDEGELFRTLLYKIDTPEGHLLIQRYPNYQRNRHKETFKVAEEAYNKTLTKVLDIGQLFIAV